MLNWVKGFFVKLRTDDKINPYSERRRSIKNAVNSVIDKNIQPQDNTRVIVNTDINDIYSRINHSSATVLSK